MKNTQKQKKTLAWFVVNPTTGYAEVAPTRDTAREVKLSCDKILRVEIVDGKPNAKFVR